MKKFVEYEKLSKKQKREIDKARRATWGDVSPVTKRIESAKIYNRKKHQRGGYDSGAGVFDLWGYNHDGTARMFCDKIREA